MQGLRHYYLVGTLATMVLGMLCATYNVMAIIGNQRSLADRLATWMMSQAELSAVVTNEHVHSRLVKQINKMEERINEIEKLIKAPDRFSNKDRHREIMNRIIEVADDIRTASRNIEAERMSFVQDILESRVSSNEFYVSIGTLLFTALGSVAAAAATLFSLSRSEKTIVALAERVQQLELEKQLSSK